MMTKEIGAFFCPFPSIRTKQAPMKDKANRIRNNSCTTVFLPEIFMVNEECPDLIFETFAPMASLGICNGVACCQTGQHYWLHSLVFEKMWDSVFCSSLGLNELIQLIPATIRH
jgi:hypothetical protein